MTKISKLQMAFDEQIYAQPDSEKEPSKPSAKTAGSKSKKKKPATTETLQPFLPGLSRRGRPRSKNPIPSAVRAAESRKRRIEAGGKRIELLLEPSVAADLDLLTDYYKISRAELLGKLIGKAAKRIRRED